MKNNLLFLISCLLFPISAICQEDGYVKTDNGVIHYKTYGNGEPILIINGGPGLDCEGFSSLAELISDKYMTILYDQRGTGKSELNPVDSITVTMDLMVKDIEALRNYLEIKEWIVLGHSFGGWIAEYYASCCPESISAMILSGSGGIDMEILDYFNANLQMRLSQAERDSLKYWNNILNKGDTTFTARYNKAKYLASAYLFNKKFIPVLALRLANAGNPEITGLVYKDLFKIRFDCKESLRNFSKPVLIIQGRQDIVGSGTAYKTHLTLKNSELVFLNECCHYGWLEQEKQYIDEIENFIMSIQ
jgi:proline iminopeptidase